MRQTWEAKSEKGEEVKSGSRVDCRQVERIGEKTGGGIRREGGGKRKVEIEDDRGLQSRELARGSTGRETGRGLGRFGEGSFSNGWLEREEATGQSI